MRVLILIAVAATLLGASSPTPSARTPEAQAKLDKLLAGRVPGEQKTCIAMDRTKGPIGIDDQTLLFRDGPRIWRNNLEAGFQCGDLSGRKSLVTRANSMRMCSGDTVSIVDLSDGSAVGGCILGDFVPYTKP